MKNKIMPAKNLEWFQGNHQAALEFFYDAYSDPVMFCRMSENLPFLLSIEYANPAFYACMGYEARDLLKQSPALLFRSGSYGKETEKLLAGIIENIAIDVEMPVYKANGEAFWANLNATPLGALRGRNVPAGWSISIRNISSHRQLEQNLWEAIEKTNLHNLALKRALDRESISQRIHDEISMELDSSCITQRVTEILGEALRVDKCMVQLATDKPWESSSNNATFMKTLIKREQVLAINDVRADTSCIGMQWQLPASPRAIMAMPIRFNGTFMGVLWVFMEHDTRNWQVHEMNLLEAAARKVALAFDRTRMHDELQNARASTQALRK